MTKEIFVSIGVDVDAIGGWLGSYGGEDSPGDISRGVFAGEVGVPRLNTLFEREEITTTWFWPGHSVESFPEQFDQVVASGHEIGLHGYSHENPLAMSREQEADVLDHTIELISTPLGHPPHRLRRPLVGVQPRHQRAPRRTRHPLRPLPHAPRLRAVLRARQGLLDAHRLQQARGRVDEAVR
ncbi:MAG: polysaccharide deacetylase family protein, partial [Aeromicrobium erythreum]